MTEDESMPQVTIVGNEPPSSWEAARLQLLGLPDGGSLSFGVDGSTWLIVLHISAFGYLVSGQGMGDRDYFTLIERSLGDDPVTAFDGGNMNDYPRYTFVSADLMLKAVKTYFHSGVRDGECEWVSEEDAVY
jgi:hypothetical protein